MNKQPIETARDCDLRLSFQAMQRAALSARALATQTGTALVVSRNGVIEHIRPQPASPRTREPQPPYGEQP